MAPSASVTEIRPVIVPVVVRPPERRIWAWKHGRGELKHGIEHRVIVYQTWSDGTGYQSDVVDTLCGKHFDSQIDFQDGDVDLPWCKTCARKLRLKP